MNVYISVLFKDHRILKIIFVFLTFYLLIEDIILFLIIKPTLTSGTQRRIGPQDFPDILVCPEEGFDLNTLIEFGYSNSVRKGFIEKKKEPKGRVQEKKIPKSDIVQKGRVGLTPKTFLEGMN